MYRISNQNNKNSDRPVIKINALSIVPIVIAIIIAAVIILPNATKAQSTALDAGKNAYNEAKDKKTIEVYDNFYNAAFEQSEKKYHTTNDVLISVCSLRETAELEVLEVNAADVKEYTFGNEFTKPVDFINELISWLGGSRQLDPVNAVVWLEGKCTGVFRIDLNASEIVIDNDNHYVLIRLPAPTLKFTSHEFEVKYFNNGTMIDKVFDGSAQTGLDAAMKDTADMTAHLHDTLNKNHNYRDMARKSAETLIVNLVKGLNSDITDLTVEVTFFS